jgi:alpha-1,3/alpha-1,6-mannosyltransferase
MLNDRPLTILSPSINCEFFNKQIKRICTGDTAKQLPMETSDGIDSQVKTIFLSLNRFERKKCIELAIHSFGNSIKTKFKIFSTDYLCKHSNHPEIEKECALFIAGGYDPLNAENIEYFTELKALVGSLGLQQNVHFTKSPG